MKNTKESIRILSTIAAATLAGSLALNAAPAHAESDTTTHTSERNSPLHEVTDASQRAAIRIGKKMIRVEKITGGLEHKLNDDGLTVKTEATEGLPYLNVKISPMTGLVKVSESTKQHPRTAKPHDSIVEIFSFTDTDSAILTKITSGHYEDVTGADVRDFLKDEKLVPLMVNTNDSETGTQRLAMWYGPDTQIGEAPSGQSVTTHTASANELLDFAADIQRIDHAPGLSPHAHTTV